MGNWQEEANDDFDTIKMGSPSSFWSYGLNKRLEKVKKIVDFKGKKVLDVGCGIGMFLSKFQELGGDVYGVDVDERKIEIAKKTYSNVFVSPAEKLDFADNTFDIVFSHETIEHVDDDKKAIEESLRVLKPGGLIVIFCPNIRWPFETHGIYVDGKYQFGNKFGVTYLPREKYKKLIPHVRNYSNKDLLGLFDKNQIEVVHHSHVFPGFDGLVNRAGVVGKIARTILDLLESTPLHYFGISHFLVVKKR